MAKTTYTQCMMEQPSDGGVVRYVAWIPSRFAVVGKRLEIEDKDGEWTVRERYATKDGDYVEEISRDYTRQREASDI